MQKKHFPPIFLLLAIFCFSINIVYSQADTITYKKSFLSYKYFINGKKASANKVLKIIPDSTIAYNKFASANESLIFGYIFSGLGSALIITPIIMSCFNNNKGWSMAYAGAGISLVSIPLFIKHKKQVPKAINLHNGINNDYTLKLNFGVNNNGIGFCLRF